MRQSGILKVAYRTIFSKFFLITSVIWIAISFMASVVGVGFTMNTVGINYQIPDSTTSSLFQYNGSGLTYTAQNFNQYGDGITGTEVFYNLSASASTTGSILQPVSGGYAGTTNSTGFIHFSLSLVQGMTQYFLDVHFRNPSTSFNQNTSDYVSTITTSGTQDLGNAAVSPVKSITDPGTFALHIWSSPGFSLENASVFYQSSPLISNLYSYPLPFNQSKMVHIAQISLAGPENVQTGLLINNYTYYYLAGVESNSGAVEGSVFFQAVPTAAMQTVQSVDSVFGLSTLVAVFCTFPLVLLLSTGYEHRKKWLERTLPDGFPDQEGVNKSTMFIRRVSVTTIASLPILAITALFAYYSSWSQFGSDNGVIPVMVCSAGFLFSIVISASYVSILLGRGFLKNLATGSSEFKKFSRNGTIAFIPLVPVEVIFFSFNFNGFAYNALSPAFVVVANYFNPFAYVNTLLQVLSNSVTFGMPYTFNPSAYYVTYPLILVGGFLWLLAMLAVPYLWFRKKEREKLP